MASLTLIFSLILMGCNTLELGDVALTRSMAESYCPLAIIDSTPSTLQKAIKLCNTQTYNTEYPQCFVGNCESIIDNKLVKESCKNNPKIRRPFIYDEERCNENEMDDTCSYSSASAFDLALLPKGDNIATNQLVCIEYKYYMAICVLLMIAFASFLCFIVVALNKLKQLRERSYLY